MSLARLDSLDSRKIGSAQGEKKLYRLGIPVPRPDYTCNTRYAVRLFAYDGLAFCYVRIFDRRYDVVISFTSSSTFRSLFQ